MGIMLSYADLRNIEQKEKSSSSLTEIGSDFYQHALAHIKELENRAEEEAAKNPSGKKTMLLAEELRNTKRIWENILERREKKIVLAALSMMRGGTHRLNSLSREETIFYESIETALKVHREYIMKSQKKETTTIRMLKDVPQFVGTDLKKYTLKKEDVLSLPTDVATVLIQRKAAEEITPSF